MRIGLLGSGGMGRQHMAAAAGLPDVEMVTRNTPPFDTLDPADREGLLNAMLADASIDAIDICLPTPTHVQTACAALAAGKHVLCEKPMALSADDCERILNAQRASGRTLMVAQVLRFFPAYRQLAQFVRGGRLGRARSAVFTRESGVPNWAPWMADTNQSGGAILDLLVHDFDQAIELFGYPATIQASRIESANTVRAHLQCGEVEVRVEGGWFVDGRPFSMGFEVEFGRGRLVYRHNTLVLDAPGLPMESVQLADVDPYREQLRYFTQCCMQNIFPAECPPTASVAAVELALTVRDRVA
ncbi:MAG TPA: Gfo/Idh/MocA family oxidoreductase [Terracidiphilus sp.]